MPSSVSSLVKIMRWKSIRSVGQGAPLAGLIFGPEQARLLGGNQPTPKSADVAWADPKRANQCLLHSVETGLEHRVNC